MNSVPSVLKLVGRSSLWRFCPDLSAWSCWSVAPSWSFSNGFTFSRAWRTYQAKSFYHRWCALELCNQSTVLGSWLWSQPQNCPEHKNIELWKELICRSSPCTFPSWSAVSWMLCCYCCWGQNPGLPMSMPLSLGTPIDSGVDLEVNHVDFRWLWVALLCCHFPWLSGCLVVRRLACCFQRAARAWGS